MTAKPRESFKLKLCLWILGISLATFASVFAACIYFVRIEVKDDLDAVANAKLDYAIRALDEGLTNTEVSADNLYGICNSPLINNSRDSIYSLFKHFLEVNPRIQGVCIGYESETGKRTEQGFCPYLMRSGDGYIYRDLAKIKKYREKEWYKTAHDTGKPSWSKPFIESNGTIITSYTMPMRNANGKVYAIMAVDLNLNVMADSIQKLRPYPSAMLTVIDQDGTFAAHPNHDFILKESLQSIIDKAEYAPNRRILENIKAHKRGADTYFTKEDKIFLYHAPVAKNGWTVTLEVPRNELRGSYDHMFRAILFDMIVGVVLLIVVCIVIINRIAHPLEEFAEAAKQISHGNFNVKLPVIEDHNELYDLRQALATMEGSLHKYMQELEDTVKSKATIEGELNIARNIQMAMIPKIFPPYPDRNDLDIYASLTPAKAVGGDLYDFILDGDKLYFCIGDVSGKGVPASLFMAITRTLFRNIALNAKSPDKIATMMNDAIADGNDENMFVTMFIGMCNLSTGELTCCNCGHNAPITNGKLIDTLSSNISLTDNMHFMEHVPVNIPIGVIKGFEYKQIKVHLQSGITIYLYTDGVTEAENKIKQLYGDDRLLKLVETCGKEASAKDIVDNVLQDVKRHAILTEQSDDITMLCLKLTGERAAKKMFTLSINNKVEEIAKLAPFIDEVSESFSIKPDVAFQLNLAMDEALANTVNYAYPKDTDGLVTLEAEKDDNTMIFRMIDHGIPFDPTKDAAEVDVTLGAEDRPIGGLGIFLIKQMMDEVKYLREGDRNILTMKKTLK